MIDASAGTCLRALGDVERWPEWFSRVRRVEVLERGVESTPLRVAIEASVLRFHPQLVATVAGDGASRFELERVPNEPGDDEVLRLTVTVEPRGARALARAAIEAQVDAPRSMPLPHAVADHFAAELLHALAGRCMQLAGPFSAARRRT
jgi:Polyketide cyclase / dehydrase and lipid transport